ncbi:Uncharacterized protein TPAR_00087 [Tolypocladium paradoxum]|uniref:Uncharacterized protein n=1 Tax=Tolypocladium paradoxum TaxID=94208 RepID=A0A2S4LBA2_9HYPO|nr:Uncharacterized protein TPAR_00087 [Tolypocladium paradoxum]
MDFIKKAVAGATGSSSGQQKPQEGQKQDYVDKAFDFLSKKSGHKLDPNVQEKITDGGRTAYEKATGKKVDPKISN